MKLKDVLKKSWKLYTGHFGDLFKGAVIGLAIRLMAACPLLFLADSQTRLLALLSPLLFLALVLPARQNSAEALRDLMRGGRYSTVRLVSFENYGTKLARGLKQTGKLLLWGLPLLVATGLMMAAYFGMVDVFTLMRFFISLGGGKFTTGVTLAAVIYAVLLVPLLAGMLLCAWKRHGDARDFHKMRGHYAQGMAAGLLSAVTLLPFLAVVAAVCHGYLSALVAAIGNLTTGGFALPALSSNLWIVAVGFVVTCLPLLPLKALVPAVLVDDLAQQEKPAVAA